jgi:hypothetical protein
MWTKGYGVGNVSPVGTNGKAAREHGCPVVDKDLIGGD